VVSHTEVAVVPYANLGDCDEVTMDDLW